jgi:hypothetical protein
MLFQHSVLDNKAWGDDTVLGPLHMKSFALVKYHLVRDDSLCHEIFVAHRTDRCVTLYDLREVQALNRFLDLYR